MPYQLAGSRPLRSLEITLEGSILETKGVFAGNGETSVREQALRRRNLSAAFAAKSGFTLGPIHLAAFLGGPCYSAFKRSALVGSISPRQSGIPPRAGTASLEKRKKQALAKLRALAKVQEMSGKLFVGGLSWDTTDSSLANAFSSYDVQEAKVITDRDTGRSRGFGFVTLKDGNAVQAAIHEMDGSSVDGRQIRVNEAQDRDRGGGGGGGGRGGGGGGGGGRGRY